jgi:hypothetical protein
MTLPDMWEKAKALWNKTGWKTKLVVVFIVAVILFSL